MTSLKNIQRLYNSNRFLDAFRQSSEYWKPSTSIQNLSVEELILGGRLATRLGGWRLSRRLFRAAYARDPSNPGVRYFTNNTRRRSRLLDDLREFEENPDICAGDLKIQANWLASHGVTWAFLRDFTRAHQCLERAHGLQCDQGFVTSCESDGLGLEDRWKDALKCAELAWEISPGTPYAASSLSNSLLNLGRVPEAAERLTAASENSQSYEVVQTACWHQCAVAETLDGDDRRRVLEIALELAERLPTLAPLADRDPRRFFSRIRVDIAGLADDHAEMERWAEEARIPFYRRILANLRQNPEGRRIRLTFPRKIQKHEACLPTSLASALATLGEQLDPDVMASEITFGGTVEWAAAEWLEKRGLIIRFFAVTPETATLLIKNGIGFVLTVEGDDNAHAVAVVGLDEAAGTLLVHDPMTYRTAEYLLEGLAKNREPLGMKGMAVVPPEPDDVNTPRLQRRCDFKSSIVVIAQAVGHNYNSRKLTELPGQNETRSEVGASADESDIDARNLLRKAVGICCRVTNHRSAMSEDRKCRCIRPLYGRMREVDSPVPCLLNLCSSHTSGGINQKQDVFRRCLYLSLGTISRPEGQLTFFV